MLKVVATMPTLPSFPSGVSEVSTRISEMPVGLHIIVGVGLAAGLIMWLMGRRVLRPMFSGIGLAIGAAAGFFLAPGLGIPSLTGIASPYIGLVAGGIIGLVAAALLFRTALALAAGATFAAALSIGAATYLHFRPLASVPAPLAPIERFLAPGDSQAQAPSAEDVAPTPRDYDPDAAPWDRVTPPPDGRSSIGDALENEAVAKAKEFMAATRQAISEQWASNPPPHRVVIFLAGVLGAGLGGLVGLVLPKRGAALVTSITGSAVWLPCALWTAHATGVPMTGVLDQPPPVWLGVWLGVATLGLTIQLLSIARGRKKADA